MFIFSRLVFVKFIVTATKQYIGNADFPHFSRIKEAYLHHLHLFANCMTNSLLFCLEVEVYSVTPNLFQ